jgi:hypothetical protein
MVWDDEEAGPGYCRRYLSPDGSRVMRVRVTFVYSKLAIVEDTVTAVASAYEMSPFTLNSILLSGGYVIWASNPGNLLKAERVR